jgi:hypothetical protein
VSMKAGDCYTCGYESWQKITERFRYYDRCQNPVQIRAMLKELDQGLGIPFELGVVYTYYLPTNAILYVGQSGNMKSRILSHLTSTEWIQYVHHMSFTVCEKIDMDKIERDKIVRALIDWPDTLQNKQIYFAPNNIQDIAMSHCNDWTARLPWWTSDKIQSYELEYYGVHTIGSESWVDNQWEMAYAEWRDDNPWV